MELFLLLSSCAMILFVIHYQKRQRKQAKLDKLGEKRYKIYCTIAELSARMEDIRPEDPIICSLREEEGVIYLFCSSNEPMHFRAELARFHAEMQEEEGEIILILSQPESRSKYNKNSVYSILPHMDEYFVRKLGSEVILPHKRSKSI